jgi:hypothetical protein
MLKKRSVQSLLLTALVALFVSAAGCSRKEVSVSQAPPAYEGKYRNAQGQVVLQIKEGRAIFTNPQTGTRSDTTIQPSGDNLSVESSAGMFTMKFSPPDMITGMPASIAGDSGPLKKVQ